MAENPIQNLTAQQKQDRERESWSEFGKKHYDQQYEVWVPWLEDQYLKWFGKDNKASYATKDTLNKTKVTNVEQVDKLQDGVHGLVAGQVGKGGLLQPVGDLASKEGVNRVERGGKDEKGSYAPGQLSAVADPIAEGVKGAGGKMSEGAKGVGGYVSGIWGGKK